MTWEELSANEVHVWLLWHHNAPTDCSSFLDRLSVDEQERAARFLNDRAKLEYCLTRSSLRVLLSRYLSVDLRDLRFDYGEYGKPSLASTPTVFNHGNSSVRFNVAHTRHLSAFAFSPIDDVGVDVEFWRDVGDADRIVESKFAAEERNVYADALQSARKELFFRGWTRKEAFIKATGEGLCRSLNSFAVVIDGEVDSTSFVRIDDDEPSRWSLFNLSLGGEHSGALAVRNENATIVTREWRYE